MRCRTAGTLFPFLAVAFLASCDREAPAVADGAHTASAVGTPPASAGVPQRSTPFGDIGRRATSPEIRAWDIDANPAGTGLPAGRGSYARGAEVYRTRCALCHGVRGEGLPPNPSLVGREPRDFSFASDPRLPKTIGNYWPYATTLFDYINRAMPFDAPGSLPAVDVYSLTAYLLAENGIIDSTTVIDARTLPAVVMPARDRFVIADK